MTTRPIVVGFDGSPDARTAAQWALDEAARSARAVRMVYAFDWYWSPFVLSGVPRAWPDAEARADVGAVLAAAVDRARRTHPDVVVTSAVVDAAASTCLVEASADAAVLVVGGRGNGGFAELLVGSTAVAVSARAHCPVIVVRASTTPLEGEIVVGVDGSACSQLAIDFAFDQAARSGAPLRLLETWQPPSTRFVPPEVDLAEISATIRGELDDLVADWQRKFPEVPVVTDVRVGAPAANLVAASGNARLVVVGSRGQGGLTGAFLGSVSQELIHHAHCPIAIVREVGLTDHTG